MSTLRDIYTPPLLGVLLIPFVYVVFLYSQYEQTWTRTRFSIPDKKLRDYANGMALVTFGVKTELLRRWTRDIGADKPSNLADIVNSLRAVLEYHKRERTLPKVDPEIGWCPIRAGLFLDDEDLRTNDYHQLDDEWFAASQPKELNGEWPADNLTYYIEGDAEAVTRLRLSLNVNSDKDPESSEIALLVALQKLIRVATPYRAMFVELKNARANLAGIDLDNADLTWTHTPDVIGGYKLEAGITKR